MRKRDTQQEIARAMGLPVISAAQSRRLNAAAKRGEQDAIEKENASMESREWSGTPDANDPDNFWIDDATGERVNATTGERSKP